MVHSEAYLHQAQRIAAALDYQLMERMVQELVDLRARGGRLFLLGVGAARPIAATP